MSAPSHFDQIAERVERLLVRYEETQRTNALLQQQVEALARERDALKAGSVAISTAADWRAIASATADVARARLVRARMLDPRPRPGDFPGRST